MVDQTGKPTNRPLRGSYSWRLMCEMIIAFKLGRPKRECLELAPSRKKGQRVWKRYISPQLRGEFNKAALH